MSRTLKSPIELIRAMRARQVSSGSKLLLVTFLMLFIAVGLAVFYGWATSQLFGSLSEDMSFYTTLGIEFLLALIYVFVAPRCVTVVDASQAMPVDRTASKRVAPTTAVTTHTEASHALSKPRLAAEDFGVEEVMFKWYVACAKANDVPEDKWRSFFYLIGRYGNTEEAVASAYEELFPDEVVATPTEQSSVAVVTGDEFFGPLLEAPPTKVSIVDRVFGWVAASWNSLTEKFGEKGANGIVILGSLGILILALLSTRPVFLYLLPIAVVAVFLGKNWSIRSKAKNTMYAGIAGVLVVGLLFGAFYVTKTVNALGSSPVMFLSSLVSGDNEGGFFTSLLSRLNTEDPTEASVEVVLFTPDLEGSQDFVYTEGAVNEIEQAVQVLNSVTSLVSEAEKLRQEAQAGTEEGNQQVLKTGFLLAGSAGARGIVESNNKLQDWCTSSVYDATNDVTIPTSYAERVNDSAEQLAAEGANTVALISTADQICAASQNFVEVLKALDMPNEDATPDVESAERFRQEFEYEVAQINGALASLFGAEVSISYDFGFLTNFHDLIELKNTPAATKPPSVAPTSTRVNGLPAPGQGQNGSPRASLTTTPEPTATNASKPEAAPTEVATSEQENASFGCTLAGAELVYGFDSSTRIITPYADAGYLPADVSFVLEPVPYECGSYWANLAGGTVAVRDIWSLVPGAHYSKYILRDGTGNITEWGFQDITGGNSVVIYQVPATVPPVAATVIVEVIPTLEGTPMSGCADLFTGPDGEFNPPADLHFQRTEVVNGNVVIVPFGSLADISLSWPPEAIPFTIQNVPAVCGTHWVLVSGTRSAYADVLGLSPGITYYRKLLRDGKGEVIGYAYYVSGTNEEVFSWVYGTP